MLGMNMETEKQAKLRMIKRSRGDEIDWIGLREAIRQAIETKMMSQAELAKSAGISVSFLNNYLSGRYDIAVKNAEKIMQALDMRYVRVAHAEKVKK